MCDYRFFIDFFDSIEIVRTIFGKLVVWKSYTAILTNFFNANKSGSPNDEI